MAHDLAVFACSRFGFVGIHHQIGWATVAFLGHERPLEAGWKTRTAAPAQTRILHLLNDPIATLLDQLVGAIPMAARLRAFQRAVVHSVQVGKDTILISEHIKSPHRGRLVWPVISAQMGIPGAVYVFRLFCQILTATTSDQMNAASAKSSKSTSYRAGSPKAETITGANTDKMAALAITSAAIRPCRASFGSSGSDMD